MSHVARQKKSTQNQLMHFKKEPLSNFHFFHFHIKRTQQNHDLYPNSHWTITAHYPESTIFKNTRRISRGQLTITHDDYQQSTKPIYPYNENDLKS